MNYVTKDFTQNHCLIVTVEVFTFGFCIDTICEMFFYLKLYAT